jgi:hypothetical protein
MNEHDACALLKRRFEAAGLTIAENQMFDEDGVRFEMDGFDAARRVGYEYVTRDAGDDWDVDGEVVAALAARQARGELHVLIVDEREAADAAALDARITAFLAQVAAALAGKPAGKAAPPPTPAAKKASKPKAAKGKKAT